jgi:hypothetical protein
MYIYDDLQIVAYFFLISVQLFCRIYSRISQEILDFFGDNFFQSDLYAGLKNKDKISLTLSMLKLTSEN